MRDITAKTPWLGQNFDESTRPVQTSKPTAKQIAETVVQEMEDPGWLVSFFDGDDVDVNTALLILAQAVLEQEKPKTRFINYREDETLEESLQRRRLRTCVEAWPECESGLYDPRCCRFPKSCSPHAHIEAFQSGNLTDSDLERA